MKLKLECVSPTEFTEVFHHQMMSTNVEL